MHLKNCPDYVLAGVTSEDPACHTQLLLPHLLSDYVPDYVLATRSDYEKHAVLKPHLFFRNIEVSQMTDERMYLCTIFTIPMRIHEWGQFYIDHKLADTFA